MVVCWNNAPTRSLRQIAVDPVKIMHALFCSWSHCPQSVGLPLAASARPHRDLCVTQTLELVT